MKQSGRLNLCDKKHMLADVEVWCAPMLSGSIVPSHCWFRDRVRLPSVSQAQSLDNSVPYHINVFMNADDGLGLWCAVLWRTHLLSRFYIQGDSGGKSIIFEVIVSIIVRKKNVHMYMCLIRNGYWDRAVWISRRIDFCFWGWMKGEVYERKVDTRDELPAFWIPLPE